MAANFAFHPLELIASARETAGLTALGDETFVTALGKLTQSMNEEVHFSRAGHASMRERLERLIANRLRFTADLAANPDILNEVLLPPVVILGLPRVGSTKLHRMLAASGLFQDLLFWQVYNPARISGESRAGADPRIELARRYVEWRNSTNPAANAGHRIDVNEVEEETFLLEFSFETIYPMTFVSADSYYEWLQTRDQSETYGYLGKLLKYLQWQFHKQDPRPWILKSPPNLGFEKQILSFAPDARFVMSHRDPLVLIPSMAAMATQSHKLYCEEFDRETIGKWVLREFSSAVRRHIAWRKANPQIPVLDLAYADVEKNPLDVASRFCGFLGIEFTDAMKASIGKWLTDDSHGKDMRHEYSLEACGLTATQIEEAFAEYIEMFRFHLYR